MPKRAVSLESSGKLKLELERSRSGVFGDLEKMELNSANGSSMYEPVEYDGFMVFPSKSWKRRPLDCA